MGIGPFQQSALLLVILSIFRVHVGDRKTKNIWDVKSTLDHYVVPIFFFFSNSTLFGHQAFGFAQGKCIVGIGLGGTPKGIASKLIGQEDLGQESIHGRFPWITWQFTSRSISNDGYKGLKECIEIFVTTVPKFGHFGKKDSLGQILLKILLIFFCHVQTLHKKKIFTKMREKEEWNGSVYVCVYMYKAHITAVLPNERKGPILETMDSRVPSE
mmetsp:Transcript_18944/g.44092  ORF Transcript_18944/g.44092 Transcript_18944/m.44092 type:complete len:214 (+) Transcript_18944:328-969(+)